MSGFSKLREDFSNVELLEKELNIKNLQIKRLLTITQAINNNVSAEGLFEMYRNFLGWEMGVERMALFFKQEEQWRCTAHVGILETLLEQDITPFLHNFKKLDKLEHHTHPLIGLFDVVIPVSHKETPLAYVFIGGFEENEDMYNKVQFITTITNIIAVAIENKRLFKRQLEQERLKREMELASAMQRTLIPKKLPSSEYYELASVYMPHLIVGGDYFDFVEMEDDRFIFCIGDISGKGVAAALLMANFQAYFHTLIKERRNLDDFVRSLNASVFESTHGEKFLTFFIAEYNLKNKTLQYVNAGHPPPAMVMNQQLYHLDQGTTILGAFPELPFLKVGNVRITAEALILTFTDGLTDIQNEQGEFMDEKRGSEFVMKHHHLPVQEFNNRLVKALERFKGNRSYPDDFTILTCRIF